MAERWLLDIVGLFQLRVEKLPDQGRWKGTVAEKPRESKIDFPLVGTVVVGGGEPPDVFESRQSLDKVKADVEDSFIFQHPEWKSRFTEFKWEDWSKRSDSAWQEHTDPFEPTPFLRVPKP